MSNWPFLNAHRVTPKHDPAFGTTPEDGFNGLFEAQINGLPVRMVASDGMGWEHVSVSLARSLHTPSWSIMCQVKALFWDEETTVMQLHPPRSIWVDVHPGCLHLWRPTMEGIIIPLPHPIMVGPEFTNGEPVPPIT